MTDPVTDPVTSTPPARSLGPVEVAGAVLVVATAVALLAVRVDLLAEVGRASRSSPALGAVLGWVPVGGLATWLAVVLLWRAHRLRRGRSTTRVVDRAAGALTCAWLGLAIAAMPGRRPGRDWPDQVRDLAGPEVLTGLRWSVAGVGVALVVGLVAAAVVFRGASRDHLPPAHAQLRLGGLCLAAVFPLLLVVLVLTA